MSVRLLLEQRGKKRNSSAMTITSLSQVSVVGPLVGPLVCIKRLMRAATTAAAGLRIILTIRPLPGSRAQGNGGGRRAVMDSFLNSSTNQSSSKKKKKKSEWLLFFFSFFLVDNGGIREGKGRI